MPDRYDRLAEILRLRDELDDQGHAAAASTAHACAEATIAVRQTGTQRAATADQRAHLSEPTGDNDLPAATPCRELEPVVGIADDDEIPF